MTPKSVLKSSAFPDVTICIPKVFPPTGTNDMQSWAAGTALVQRSRRFLGQQVHPSVR